ncbi:MAG: hypothetical protein HY077_12190 [Elusimicrobia bacterium]|nr:hypothetical protein [Elusimicrobiota bacterium]
MRRASAANALKLWAALLLAATCARAADPVRVDLSLKSPAGIEVRVGGTQALDEKLLLPAGVELPVKPLSSGEIPVLPPTAITDGALAVEAGVPGAAGHAGESFPQAALSKPESAPRGAEPMVLASLQGIAAPQPGAEPAPRYFDQGPKAVSTYFPGDLSAPDELGPKRPRGVTAVTVDVVHGAADITRLIPNGVNSDELKRQLIENVDTMAPYTIYTFHDAKGGKFTGIDLSRNPKLVEVLPEQQSHEVKLIKKIQLWNQDLQVLVRETGKTPDLVVGGVVTELKSLIGDKVDLTYLVNKANNQVHEHAERHRLGNGAVVIDLTEETSVPVAKVAQELDLWRKMPEGYEIPGFYTGPRVKKQAIALDKVYVFAGSDLRMFVRHKDGSYRLSEPAEIPFALAGNIDGFKKHQLFLRKPGLARPPPQETALGQALDQFYLVKELRLMVAKGRVKRAFEIWREFELTNKDDVVKRVKNQIREIWPDIIRGRKNRDGGRRFR